MTLFLNCSMIAWIILFFAATVGISLFVMNTFAKSFVPKLVSYAKYSKSLFANVHSSRQKWQAIRKLSKRSPSKIHITNELADKLNVKFSNSFVSSDIQSLTRLISRFLLLILILMFPSMKFSKN